MVLPPGNCSYACSEAPVKQSRSERVAVLCGLAALSLALASSSTGRAIAALPGQAGLKAPFDVPTGGPGPMRSGGKSCPTITAPMVSLDVDTRYRPGRAADSVSPEAEADYRQAMAPVIAYMSSTTNQANRYVKSGGRDLAAADCARSALSAWAQGNAFSQVSGSAGWFKLSTLLSGLSLTYLQVREAPADSAGQAENRQIEQWLGHMAAALLEFRRSGVKGSPVHNNQLYWAGLAIGATGAAIGNTEDFEFGMKALQEGACAVTPQGSLPMEIKRGRLALHYHVYALQPLLLLAELAERNGRPGYALCGGGISRLANAVLAGADNPEPFAQEAGQPQQSVLDGAGLPKALWGWLAIYAQRQALPPIWQQRLANSPRLAAAETGGDEVTLYPLVTANRLSR